MTKSKLIVLTLIIISIFAIIVAVVMLNTPKDLTLKMYEKITNSPKFTLTMDVESNEGYEYKIIIAERETDISMDVTTKYDEEEQHTTTLVSDGYAYYIAHNDEEYSIIDSGEIDLDESIPMLSDIDKKEYIKGKENIRGKTYYYEEYEDISTFLMLINLEEGEEEEKVKTRFFYDKDGNIAFIKNIIERSEDKSEELIKVSCEYDANDSLFEVPESYAEI